MILKNVLHCQFDPPNKSPTTESDTIAIKNGVCFREKTASIGILVHQQLLHVLVLMVADLRDAVRIA